MLPKCWWSSGSSINELVLLFPSFGPNDDYVLFV